MWLQVGFFRTFKWKKFKYILLATKCIKRHGLAHSHHDVGVEGGSGGLPWWILNLRMLKKCIWLMDWWYKILILNLWMAPLFTHIFALFYIIYKFICIRETQDFRNELMWWIYSCFWKMLFSVSSSLFVSTRQWVSISLIVVAFWESWIACKNYTK